MGRTLEQLQKQKASEQEVIDELYAICQDRNISVLEFEHIIEGLVLKVKICTRLRR